LKRPASSQFVSALLLAAPLAGQDVMIEISGPLPSKPYVRMTLGIMEAFGVMVVEDRMEKFIIPGGQTYAATQYGVEPDATGASYFLAAAALTGGRVTVEGLGRESCQGDASFVEVLARMGCRVEQAERSTTVWGPAGGKLRGVDVDLNDMPDVAQTLAVLAAFAEGVTRIRNVANLRIKETDRLQALATELGRLGVRTEVQKEGITIRPDQPPQAAAIETYGDHRMAMSFALAGLRVPDMVIRDPACVGKTFPGFFDLWTELGR
jgi:3-phosphoshikimate 1-carboxyvinyltransferase